VRAFPAANAQFIIAALAYKNGVIHSGHLAEASIGDSLLGVARGRVTSPLTRKRVTWGKKIGRRLAREIGGLKFVYKEEQMGDPFVNMSEAIRIGVEFVRGRQLDG